MKRNPLKYEISEAARYAEKYWENHGYYFSLLRSDKNRDQYAVSKNGVIMAYSVSASVRDFSKEMEIFEEKFEQYTPLWPIMHHSSAHAKK